MFCNSYSGGFFYQVPELDRFESHQGKQSVLSPTPSSYYGTDCTASNPLVLTSWYELGVTRATISPDSGCNVHLSKPISRVIRNTAIVHALRNKLSLELVENPF